eukprot:5568657-Pleurochrysis_carterae.AAC.2
MAHRVAFRATVEVRPCTLSRKALQLNARGYIDNSDVHFVALMHKCIGRTIFATSNELGFGQQ